VIDAAVLVVGGGAIGGVTAAKLTGEVRRVVVLDADREHVERLRGDGLLLDDLGDERRVVIEACADPDELGERFDFALVTLKAAFHQAALPPYMYQALLRAEAPELATAIAFLEAARDAVPSDTVVINEPIPMTMTRVHNVDRAQLLVESNSRPALQAFLNEWVDALRAMKTRVRWSLEVDPLDI